jgi:hypothetical protein
MIRIVRLGRKMDAWINYRRRKKGSDALRERSMDLYSYLDDWSSIYVVCRCGFKWSTEAVGVSGVFLREKKHH